MKNSVIKRSLFSSYLAGITDDQQGNSYATIITLFLPELITAFMLMVSLFDLRFIGELHSTAFYVTVSVAYTFIHMIIKIGEGLSVGAVILCGHYNGAGDTKNVGNSLSATLWVSVILGAVISGAIYCGATALFGWYQVPQELIAIGASYLRVRCISIFFMFISYGIVGFLRGVKNTKIPMQLFMLGAALFVLFDYLLIFGKCGFPALGLLGSAWAGVIQYAAISVIGFIYIVFSNYYARFQVPIFNLQVSKLMGSIMWVSLPVMVDKAALAFAKMWLGRLIGPLGGIALGTFSVIKDMEQFAFVPAIAFAQVVTLLVSNDFGSNNWQGIKSTIKKVLFLSSLCVLIILVLFSCMPRVIITQFDTKQVFTAFAATAFPIISVLVFFDILQLILAAALRGAGQVRLVMLVRMVTLTFFFVPLSYGISLLPLENTLIKFILIYSSFYIGNGLMGIIYLTWFRCKSDKRHHGINN